MPEVEVTQPDGSTETPTLDEIEQASAAEAEESQAEPESEQPEQPEQEDDELVVQIGDEPPPAPEERKTPEWVRDLRKQHRELQKQNRELQARLQQTTAPAQPVTLGPKPTLESLDYDAERYETALEKWYERKRQIEHVHLQAKQAEEAQTRSWQERLDVYSRQKTELKVKDYDDAESLAQEVFDVVQQGVILQGAENPALVVYALGKNVKRAKELASIKDPVKFAVAIGKLEKDMKVTPRRSTPPPERTVSSGSAPISGSIDSTLERLRAEAEKTGDMTKVIRYKQQQREKTAAKR